MKSKPKGQKYRNLYAWRGSIVCVLALSTVAAAGAVAAEPKIVFEGVPARKVSSDAWKISEASLTASQAAEYSVRIVLDGDRYLWASRKNTPLRRVESGAFVIFTAENGSGFVRSIKADYVEVVEGIGAPEGIVYAEHLMLGLDSVTYYGRDVTP